MTELLQVEGREGGPVMTVTYRLLDTATGAWALVDPTYEVMQTWSDWLGANAPAPQAILLTHAHFDHIGGLADVRRRFPNVPVYSHPDGLEMIKDPNLNGAARYDMPCEPSAATNTYREGDVFDLGRSRFKVIDAPGHCPGSVVLLCGDVLIAGDVIFRGAIGRWDLPGADYATLARTIREKIMTLPNATKVYPGHGVETTIGDERRRSSVIKSILARESVE